MLNSSESLPTAVRRVAFALRNGGWVCFWVQLVLAVISALILLFALPSAVPRAATAGSGVSNPGSGSGLFFAVCGLAVLGYSVYLAFRYTRLSLQLKNSPSNLRPTKADTIKAIRAGLTWNLVGMSLTLIGAEAITGTLLGKSLSQPRAFYNPGINLTEFIQPLDIFVVLANTHAIFAHFIGIAIALWLLNTIFGKET